MKASLRDQAAPPPWVSAAREDCDDRVLLVGSSPAEQPTVVCLRQSAPRQSGAEHEAHCDPRRLSERGAVRSGLATVGEPCRRGGLSRYAGGHRRPGAPPGPFRDPGDDPGADTVLGGAAPSTARPGTPGAHRSELGTGGCCRRDRAGGARHRDGGLRRLARRADHGAHPGRRATHSPGGSRAPGRAAGKRASGSNCGGRRSGSSGWGGSAAGSRPSGTCWACGCWRGGRR